MFQGIFPSAAMPPNPIQQSEGMRRAKGPNSYQPWATPKVRAPTSSPGPTARPMPPASPWRIHGRHHRESNAVSHRSSCPLERCPCLATSRTSQASSSSRQPRSPPGFWFPGRCWAPTPILSESAMGRAFSPLSIRGLSPGALPQAGMEARRWRSCSRPPRTHGPGVERRKLRSRGWSGEESLSWTIGDDRSAAGDPSWNIRDRDEPCGGPTARIHPSLGQRPRSVPPRIPQGQRPVPCRQHRRCASTAVTIANQAQVVLGGLADWKGPSPSPLLKHVRPRPLPGNEGPLVILDLQNIAGLQPQFLPKFARNQVDLPSHDPVSGCRRGSGRAASLHPQANLDCQEPRPTEPPTPEMVSPRPRSAPQPAGLPVPPGSSKEAPKVRLAPKRARRSAPESSCRDCGASSIENPSPNPKPEHRATPKPALRFPDGTA